MSKSLQWYFVPYGLLLLIGFGTYFQADHGSFVLWVNARRIYLLDASMPWITHLGDGVAFALVTLLFLIRRWRVGLILLAMGLMQLLLSFTLKRVVFSNSPRPKTYFADLGVSLSFIEGVKVHAYNAFPSGHTMTAFGLATFLALYWQDRRLSLLLLLLAALVGFSRIYLLQHFLIDVCVGSVIGTMLGFAVHAVSKRCKWM